MQMNTRGLGCSLWEPVLGCVFQDVGRERMWKNFGEFRFGFYKGLTDVEDEGQGRNLGDGWDQRLFFLFGLCVPYIQGSLATGTDPEREALVCTWAPKVELTSLFCDL